MDKQQKKIVVFLGSGRSGTSLAANIAHSLGLTMSEKMVEANKTNRKGAWEDIDIFNISREILKYFYRSGWKFSYLPMPDNWLDDSYVKHKMEQLKLIISNRLIESKGMLWGFKEPVTAKLLPMWQLIFNDLGIDPIYILCIRNPEDVFVSFEKAYGTPRPVSKLLWLSRYSDAIEYTKGKFSVVDYDLWFSQPELQCKKMLDAFEFDSSINTSEIIEKVIDQKLHTAKSSIDIVDNHYCNQLYHLLSSYAGSNNDILELQMLNTRVLNHFKDFAALSYSVNHMRQRLDEMGQRLEKMGQRLEKYTHPYKKFSRTFSRLPTFRNKIIGGVASYQDREKSLKVMVASILPQVDELIIYLNNYEESPKFLEHPKITIFRSQLYENLSANGKVFYLDNLKSCYFFSLDDDIEYPSNYVEKMIQCLNKYQNKVGVSVHGSILPEQVKWYFERYATYAFQRELETDKFVNLIGSGTFAFHTDTLSASFSDFYGDVMVDLRFSILAKEQKVPLVCIARPSKWLRALVPEDGLYQKFLTKETIHTKKSVQHNPWGYQTYRAIIQPVIRECFATVDNNLDAELKLDKPYIDSLKNNTIPDNWCETDVYRNSVEDRKAVFNPIAYKNKLQNRIKELQKANTRLENSKPYLFGQLVAKAVKKPGMNTIKLPFNLVKLALGKYSA